MKTRISFKATAPLKIPCPICKGNCCEVCKFKGKISVEVDGTTQVSIDDIVKYVVENMHEVAELVTKKYGRTPQIGTEEVIQQDEGTYEIVKISSLGGVTWVVHRVDKLSPPLYFNDYQKLIKWKGGQIE